MRGEIVTLGAARSTCYALRDNFRGLGDMPVYRVNTLGQIKWLGQLIAVRPNGFVMVQSDGLAQHYEGLPWWAVDMRPQGFLGRAYARKHAAELRLPPDVRHWSETDALRALLTHGGDAVGNVLLGDAAKDRFVNSPLPDVVETDDYLRMAQEVLAEGETWSSAGGEQPKFCVYTASGHVLVKFTEPVDNPVSQRWKDLLLTEHLALQTLASAGVAAAVSSIVDNVSQRFLALERFDRVGALGRRAQVSLAALDGEFTGNATAPWPVVCAELARSGVITAAAHRESALLFAFGTLIGNTDMHHGNLSFVSDEGLPYALSPAYDMLPMAFRPSAGGALPNTLTPAYLHPAIDGATWAVALILSRNFLSRLDAENRFSNAFRLCIKALKMHVEAAGELVLRVECR